MISRGALNGLELNAITIGGGGFLHGLQAAAGMTATASLHGTRRVSALAMDAVLTREVARLTSHGLRAKGTATMSGRAFAHRRAVARASGLVQAAGVLKATRRPRIIAADRTIAPATLRFSVRFTAMTEIRRVMRLRDPEVMRVGPPARAMAEARGALPMIVPQAAGELP